MAEEAMDGVDAGPHPLLLYPVIKCMLKHLKFADLQKVRQVCRTWNEETFLFLSSKTKIVINGEDEMRRFLSQNLFPPCTTFEISFMSSNSVIPFLQNRGESIQSLTLRECGCNSNDLRQIIFDLLPNLVSLKIILSPDEQRQQQLDTENRVAANNQLPLLRNSVSDGCLAAHVLGTLGRGSRWHRRRDSTRSLLLGAISTFKSRVLPMYIGQHQGSLPYLKSLSLVGDFSYKSDVIFDTLRNARNLEHIVSRKRVDGEDDLFGTWFSEICFALKLTQVQRLEFDVPLTWTQVNSLLAQSFPLRRISMNFSNTPVEKLIYILERFKTLDSAEFGLENVPDTFVSQLLQRFKKSQVWIAVHSKCDTKLVFPAHSYVVLENRL